MNPLPQHRALLGVDVIGSARNPGHHLGALKAATDTMTRVALAESGILATHVTDWQSTGDGVLVTLPSSDLGALFDTATRMEELAAQHNRWSKPEVRLRIAIHVGPVGDEPGYYEPRIAHSRLLNAPAFKKIVERCLAERPDGSVNTGLIVSDDAFRTVFGGDHTRLVRQPEFASITVQDKEFSQPAWIRIPGFEARSLTAAPRQPASTASVQNVVTGDMHGVQAHTIHGGITFGQGSR
ncbi:MAG: hypothetical protein ABW224_09175 [Kibdelosporangium sp.]